MAEKQKIKPMDNEQLTENLFVLKQMLDTLNIAIAGVAYAAQVQHEKIDGVKVDDYLSWIENNLHPLVRKTNDLHQEYAKQQSELAKKVAKDVKKKTKKTTKKEKK